MNAKDVTSGTGTSADGPQAAERGLSGHLAIFPAVWWSKSAGEWFHHDPERGLMAVGTMGSLADSLPKDAQRLVPVGPLLELVRQWREIRDELNVKGDSRTALAYDLHAFQLNAGIARLLGETVTGEGSR